MHGDAALKRRLKQVSNNLLIQFTNICTATLKISRVKICDMLKLDLISGWRVIKSNVVIVTEVEVSGTQAPGSVWAVKDTDSTINCDVPYDLTYSNIESLK